MTVTVYTDGLALPSNPGTGTYGFVIYDGERKLAEDGGLAGYGVTSNFAEYTALVEALKKLKELRIEGDIVIKSDSKLVVGHMSGDWKVKGGGYVSKLREARQLLKEFGFVSFQWIPREENEEADLLTRVAYEKYRK